MEWITSAQAWVSLLTLTGLEIVLGIDNIIFVAILVSKLPKHQQDRGRVLGLGFAMLTRILLLLSLFWIMHLTKPLFSVASISITGRDLVLILGGVFLLLKSLKELVSHIKGDEDGAKDGGAGASFAFIIAQIAVLDIVFSLDSVITAVGMADHIQIMILAVIIAVGVMMFASKPIAHFIEEHKELKALALAFLVLVGGVLVAEGFGAHVDKAMIYVAMGFSLVVEIINILSKKSQK
ncbi:membrane protein [Campylobacter sp. 19-13652]|nr:membrane protein [Campylobacter sp. 19-13652]